MKSSNSEVFVLKSRDENRIYFLDTARVIAVFLVVYAHLFVNDSDVRLYVYAFHMPFFFLVSGMLHKRGSVAKLTRKLMLPIVLFIGIFILISTPFYQTGIWSFQQQYGDYLLPENLLSTFFLQLKLSVLFLFSEGKFANYYCWFLIVLFEIKILFGWIITWEQKINKIILVFIYFILFASLIVAHLKVCWLDNTLMAFPFYYIGARYKKNIIRLVSYFSGRYWALFLMLSFTILLTIVNGRVSMMGVSFGKLFFPFSFILFYLNGFIGSFLILQFSALYVKQVLLFTHISGALISILGFQGLFIPFFYGHVSLVEALVVTPLIIAICYRLHLLMIKKIPSVYGQTK